MCAKTGRSLRLFPLKRSLRNPKVVLTRTTPPRFDCAYGRGLRADRSLRLTFRAEVKIALTTRPGEPREDATEMDFRLPPRFWLESHFLERFEKSKIEWGLASTTPATVHCTETITKTTCSSKFDLGGASASKKAKKGGRTREGRTTGARERKRERLKGLVPGLLKRRRYREASVAGSNRPFCRPGPAAAGATERPRTTKATRPGRLVGLSTR